MNAESENLKTTTENGATPGKASCCSGSARSAAGKERLPQASAKPTTVQRSKTEQPALQGGSKGCCCSSG